MNGATVSTDNLHRIVYNLRLFQVGKLAKPAALLFEGDKVLGSINDNHVYITDTAPAHHSVGPWSIGIPPATLRTIELGLREVKDAFVDISLWGDTLRVFKGEANSPLECLVGFTDEMDGMLSGDDLVNYPDNGAFAVPGDKLTKLNLVKPGDYPLDLMRRESTKYGDMLQFKKGPSVRGALSILDREILREKVDSDKFLW